MRPFDDQTGSMEGPRPKLGEMFAVFAPILRIIRDHPGVEITYGMADCCAPLGTVAHVYELCSNDPELTADEVWKIYFERFTRQQRIGRLHARQDDLDRAIL